MKKATEYQALFDFQKNKDGDKIYWTSEPDRLDSHLFSFDKVTIYDLFKDYPHALTKEQKEIFDKENPFWVEFFGE